MALNLRTLNNKVWWNLLIITLGSALYSLGVKGVAVHHEFIAGGIFGTGMLIYYATSSFLPAVLTPSVWYMLLSIPLLAMGWLKVSHRFILYTMYSAVTTTIISQLITFNIGISDPMLAAIATGMLCGAGSGLTLRSPGCDGGTTIIAIILNQRYNTPIGQMTFAYNVLLFGISLTILNIDKLLYSLINIFIMASIIDSFGSMFNNRKLAFIISPKYQVIAADIFKRLGRGVTFIKGRGAFTDSERVMIMTVIHNYQLKRLEEVVYEHDEQAFVIIENTYNVLGRGFSHRKVY